MNPCECRLLFLFVFFFFLIRKIRKDFFKFFSKRREEIRRIRNESLLFGRENCLELVGSIIFEIFLEKEFFFPPMQNTRNGRARRWRNRNLIVETHREIFPRHWGSGINWKDWITRSICFRGVSLNNRFHTGWTRMSLMKEVHIPLAE